MKILIWMIDYIGKKKSGQLNLNSVPAPSLDALCIFEERMVPILAIHFTRRIKMENGDFDVD